MLVIIAVHKDGDILAQKRLSNKTVECLNKFNYGCEENHISHAIDDLSFEADLDSEEMTEELMEFIDKYENVDYFALDDRFHDEEKDFDEKEWLNRAYPKRKQKRGRK
jgi:hypothetical protein